MMLTSHYVIRIILVIFLIVPLGVAKIPQGAKKIYPVNCRSVASTVYAPWR